MAHRSPLVLRLALVLICLTTVKTGAALDPACPKAVPAATCPAPPCACAPGAAEAAYWEEKAAREARLERLLAHLVIAGVVVVFILWFIAQLI